MYVYWSLDSKLHSSLCSCSCSDSQIQTIPKEAQRFYKRQGTCTWNYWSVTSPAMSRWPDMPMKMSLLTSVFFFFLVSDFTFVFSQRVVRAQYSTPTSYTCVQREESIPDLWWERLSSQLLQLGQSRASECDNIQWPSASCSTLEDPQRVWSGKNLVVHSVVIVQWMLNEILSCRISVRKVLFFEDNGQRSEFLNLLRSELEGRIQNLTVMEMSEKEILRDAVTREQREKIVETFFKHAFSKVCVSVVSSYVILSSFNWQYVTKLRGSILYVFFDFRSWTLIKVMLETWAIGPEKLYSVSSREMNLPMCSVWSLTHSL